MDKRKSRNKNLNIPNALTALRLVLVVPFVIYFMNEEYLKAIVVLGVSGLTDIFDGMIARRFHQFTELGQMLDPLSDKLTQLAMAISLAIKQPILIPLLAIFVLKESLMVSAAIFLISKNKKKPSGSEWYGKAATILFYISFGIIVALKAIWNFESFPLSVFLLSVTAALMIYAFVKYSRTYFSILHSDDPKYKIDIGEVMDKKEKRDRRQK